MLPIQQMISTVLKAKVAWWLTACLVLVGLVGWLGPLIPYKTVVHSVCPISGSMRTQVVWFGSLKREQRLTMPLENWIKNREPDFEPQWRHLSTNRHFLLGRSFGCSTAPPILQLRSIQGLIIQNLTDEGITELIEVFRNGSSEQQKDLVARITDQVL